MTAPRLHSRGLGAAAAAAVAGCLLLAAAAWPFIDHMPLYDELLHFLAAQGLRATGEPVIASGVYGRAAAFTAIVAQALALFGDTLAAARIPALVSACLLLALLVVHTARRAGLLAGAAAGALLVFLPATLDLAVFARFYTLHAVLVLGAAIAAYEAAAPERDARTRALAAAASVLLLLAAALFQPTTLIALGAIACGVVAVLLLDHGPQARRFVRQRPLATAAAAVVLAGAGVTAALAFDLVAHFRHVPLWAEGGARRPQYYVVGLAADVPLFWPLFPVAAAVALAAQRRLALFALVVFAAALAAHSAAASKSMRYLYYALPFFCVVWGIALAGLHRFALERAGTGPHGARAASAGAGVIALALVVTALSQEGRRAARLVLGRATTEQALSYAGEADWASAVAPLTSALAAADRVVTSNSMKALYYLGRYDYELNASIVAETETGDEFGVDRRTGGRAIGTARSVADVLAMPGTSLVVIEDEKLGDARGAPAEAVAVIAARCSAVDVPAAAGVHAWRCDPRAVVAEP